jgi:hypothetical protein
MKRGVAILVENGGDPKGAESFWGLVKILEIYRRQSCVSFAPSTEKGRSGI